MDELTKEQRGALVQLRLVWAGLLLGQVVVGAVLVGVMLTRGGATSPAGGLDTIFSVLAVGALVTLTPTGFFIRNQIYKANWEGDVVTAKGYMTGNVVLLAMLESAGVLGLVLMFVSDQPALSGLAALVAMGLQAVNFPTGEPMRPHPPRL